MKHTAGTGSAVVNAAEEADQRGARRYFVYRMGFVRGACTLAIIACHISDEAARYLSFGVPIFVILSGFYLSLNLRNERALAFYRRTLKFLVLPYLIYSLVYTIPEMVHGATPERLWRDFLSSRIEPHLWFMPMIIGLYLLHPWLHRLYRRARFLTYVVALGVQVWLWPWLRTNGLPEGAATTALSCCAEIAYFVTGYVIHDQAAAVQRFCARRSGAIIGMAVVVAGHLLNRWPVPGILDAPPSRILGILMTIAAYCLITGMGRPTSKVGGSVAAWVERLGLYSFGIYLIHLLVLAVTTRGVSRLVTFDRAPLVWYLLVYVATTLGSLWVVRWLAARRWGKYVT